MIVTGNLRVGGAGGPAFKLQKPAQMRVRRRHTQRRCRTDKSCAGSIAAHPRKKRKDGAPSVGMVQCNDERGAHSQKARGKSPEDIIRACDNLCCM